MMVASISCLSWCARGFVACSCLTLSVTLLCGCSDEPPSTPPADPPAASAATVDSRNNSSGTPETNRADQAPDRSSVDTMVGAADQSAPESLPPSNVAHVQEYRLPDTRPPVDEASLAGHGIRVLRSKRLVLLTDVASADVEQIPALADALFEELESKTGPLLPALDGAEFQVTGCLIDAVERFDAAGLMPQESFTIRHGRHLGYRFWMFNPTADYYRRHLALHEFVHCFMMCEHGMSNIPPMWYTEGIAEYFATHGSTTGDIQDVSNPATVEFGILPPTTGDLEGWGRISEITRNVDRRPAANFEPSGIPSLSEILSDGTAGFDEDRQYAFAWAVTWLVRSHPEFRVAFDTTFHSRRGTEFREAFRAIPQDVRNQWHSEWPLFIDSLIEGFDVQRSFPSVAVIVERSTPESITVDVAADRDWQNSGVTIPAGGRCDITCTGRYQMHNEPEPWVSEPQGITIDYVRGRPLGEVVAMLVSTNGENASRRITVGTGTTIAAPADCTLWLQINDSAASRSENAGSARVVISMQPR